MLQSYSELLKATGNLRSTSVQDAFMNRNFSTSKPLMKSLAYGHLQRVLDPLCLSCMSCVKSHTLRCGHRICDNCDWKYQKEGQLNRCPSCQSHDLAWLKPKSASARVLHLGGKPIDGPRLAYLLYGVKQRLNVPLQHWFDLVVCSGIGVALGYMAFYFGALENGLDLVGNARDIGADWATKSFSFWAGFTHSFDDVESKPNAPAIALCFDNCIVRSYADALNTTSLEVGHEKDLLWPGAAIKEIDILRLRNLDEMICDVIAHSLYVEVDEPPLAPILYGSLRCRIPPHFRYGLLEEIGKQEMRIRISSNGQKDHFIDKLCDSLDMSMEVQISNGPVVVFRLEYRGGSISTEINNSPVRINFSS